jgi:hypothetical protein
MVKEIMATEPLPAPPAGEMPARSQPSAAATPTAAMATAAATMPTMEAATVLMARGAAETEAYRSNGLAKLFALLRMRRRCDPLRR